MANFDNDIGYRPTWAEVDLDNLAYNFGQIKKLIAPGVKVMACVKADAYGHGIYAVARELVAQGVDYLAVASIDEAVKLRQADIRTPILVLGAILPEDIEPMFMYDITATVCSLDVAEALHQNARLYNKALKIHVKVDTGMSRIGVACENALEFVTKLTHYPLLHIEGIFTHLACADMNKKFTCAQIKKFRGLVGQLEQQGVSIPYVHAANSMGVLSYPESHFNMVRPGLILYGLYPRGGLKIRLKPVLSLKTKVVFTKHLPAGQGISYGHTYLTKKPCIIATLPIGYGDGYPRNLSNKASVLVRGKLYNVSGRVCMDQIMVDVGRSRVKTGQEVILIGTSRGVSITAERLAELSQTIPYEIVCGIGSRVPRVYVHKHKDNDSFNRRRFERRPRRFPVIIFDVPTRKYIQAHTRDISRHGVRVATAEPLVPANDIRINFQVPNDGTLISSKGKVAWSGAQTVSGYQAGIDFPGTDMGELLRKTAYEI